MRARVSLGESRGSCEGRCEGVGGPAGPVGAQWGRAEGLVGCSGVVAARGAAPRVRAGGALAHLLLQHRREYSPTTTTTTSTHTRVVTVLDALRRYNTRSKRRRTEKLMRNTATAEHEPKSF